jgi:hypothetical protein
MQTVEPLEEVVAAVAIRAEPPTIAVVESAAVKQSIKAQPAASAADYNRFRH